jgi:hypothetical protein
MTIQRVGDAPDDALVMRLRHYSDNLARDQEGHDPPMQFRFKECQDRSAVLDGEGKNEGEHLTYRRVDDQQLLIIGDFLHDGKPDHEEFKLNKAED